MPGQRILAVVSASGTVVLLAILAVSFFSMRRRSDREECLGTLMRIYRSMRAGELFQSGAWDRAGTGRAFLARPDLWPTLHRIPYDVVCPVKGDTGEIDYRGPARPLRSFQPDDPICADRPGNHGEGEGGSILLRSGALFSVKEDDPRWIRAAETTSE